MGGLDDKIFLQTEAKSLLDFNLEAIAFLTSVIDNIEIIYRAPRRAGTVGASACCQKSQHGEASKNATEENSGKQTNAGCSQRMA